VPGGTPVQRQWILILRNGVVVVDWGDGLFQDVDSGDFVQVERTEISHSAQNAELELMKRSGLVHGYDANQAWFINLPERPAPLMD
jgi:hypothetical protein